jgi:hypothetical protein
MINEIFEKASKEIFAIEALGCCEGKPMRTSVRKCLP